MEFARAYLSRARKPSSRTNCVVRVVLSTVNLNAMLVHKTTTGTVISCVLKCPEALLYDFSVI